MFSLIEVRSYEVSLSEANQVNQEMYGKVSQTDDYIDIASEDELNFDD